MIRTDDGVRWLEELATRYEQAARSIRTTLQEIRTAEVPASPSVDPALVVVNDGTPVRIRLMFRQVPRRYKSFLIDHCRESGVFAKGLGPLDDDVVSRLIA